MRRNIEKMDPEREKMPAHIEYRREDSLWGGVILRDNLDALIAKIKKGKISEIKLETLTYEEIDRIGNELADTDISAIPGESEMGGEQVRVLRIGKKEKPGEAEDY